MGGGFPIWSMASMAAEGQEPLLDWIYLSVLFCFAFLFSGPSLFLKFSEIRNSDWAEILTRFSSGYYLSCGTRRGLTDLRGAHEPPGHAWPPWRTLVPRGHLGHRLVLIPPPKNHIY